MSRASRFLFQSLEEEKGFAGKLKTRAEVDMVYGRGNWLPMPEFVHEQPNGKLRPIADGARYGHNLICKFLETLDCCTACHPVQHLRALMHGLEQAGVAQEIFHAMWAATGKEVMPDAYR